MQESMRYETIVSRPRYIGSDSSISSTRVIEIEDEIRKWFENPTKNQGNEVSKKVSSLGDQCGYTPEFWSEIERVVKNAYRDASGKRIKEILRRPELLDSLKLYLLRGYVVSQIINDQLRTEKEVVYRGGPFDLPLEVTVHEDTKFKVPDGRYLELHVDNYGIIEAGKLNEINLRRNEGSVNVDEAERVTQIEGDGEIHARRIKKARHHDGKLVVGDVNILDISPHKGQEPMVVAKKIDRLIIYPLPPRNNNDIADIRVFARKIDRIHLHGGTYNVVGGEIGSLKIDKKDKNPLNTVYRGFEKLV